MEIGTKAVEREAEKLVRKLGLADGEIAVFYGTCSNWTPVALDRIVVTNRRVIASPLMPARSAWEAALSDLIEVVSDSDQKTIALSRRDGERLVLKKVPPQDHPRLLNLLGAACNDQIVEGRPVPEPGLAGEELAPFLSELGDDAATAGATTTAREEIPAKKDGAFAKLGAAVRNAAAEAEAQFAAGQAVAGALAHSATFGANTVEVYSNGYVRVGLLLTRKSPFERLRSARYTFQVQDKSAGGRALAGLMTGGLNYLASNEKRMLLLTIATDRKVHTLSCEGGMGRSEDKAGLGIEAACLGVLQAAAAPPGADAQAPAAEVPTARSLADQVRELADLHTEGLLSDAEFAAAKQRLIAGP